MRRGGRCCCWSSSRVVVCCCGCGVSSCSCSSSSSSSGSSSNCSMYLNFLAVRTYMQQFHARQQTNSIQTRNVCCAKNRLAGICLWPALKIFVILFSLFHFSAAKVPAKPFFGATYKSALVLCFLFAGEPASTTVAGELQELQALLVDDPPSRPPPPDSSNTSGTHAVTINNQKTARMIGVFHMDYV